MPRHGDERKKLPLVCDNGGKPLTGSAMDTLLRRMLEVLACPVMYSWHSFRAALACQLLEAHVPTAEILSLCRWQTKNSLRSYAQLSCDAYTKLLDSAYGCDFTQVRYAETLVAAANLMLQALQRCSFTE